MMRNSVLSSFCFILLKVRKDVTSLAHFIIFPFTSSCGRESLGLNAKYNRPSSAYKWQHMLCFSIISPIGEFYRLRRVLVLTQSPVEHHILMFHILGDLNQHLQFVFSLSNMIETT